MIAAVFCPTCEQETLTLRSGRCGFCDAMLIVAERPQKPPRPPRSGSPEWRRQRLAELDARMGSR